MGRAPIPRSPVAGAGADNTLSAHRRHVTEFFLCTGLLIPLCHFIKLKRGDSWMKQLLSRFGHFLVSGVSVQVSDQRIFLPETRHPTPETF